MSLHTTAATRFDSFNLYRTSYKKIGDHEIEVNILVPKEIAPGKQPVLVKWHGGGLVSIILIASQFIAD
jgi:cephalosporin-C deacetylase-like acetyl esterase